MSPPGSDGRIVVLERPISCVDLQAPVDRGRKGGLYKDALVQHGKAVLDEASAESQGVHQAGGEGGGVPGVAEAQGPFQRRQQFETKGAREMFSVLLDRLHFLSIDGPDEGGDGKRNPVEQVWKRLNEREGVRGNGGRKKKGTRPRFQDEEVSLDDVANLVRFPRPGEREDDVFEYGARRASASLSAKRP